MTAAPHNQAVDGAASVGSAPDDGLQVRLDAPLPRALAVGAGTALFVCGTCFHRRHRVRSLSFVLDGDEQAVAAHGMPRLDYFRMLHPGVDPYGTEGMSRDLESAQDPLLHGYRSGFWGIVRIPGPRREQSCELQLRARLHGDGEETIPLASIPLAAAPAPLSVRDPDPLAGPLIAICMATYDPPLELLRRQIESIRAQSYANWVCVLSDDCSSPERFAALREIVGEDSRVVVSRSPRRLGFYMNFERALSMAPREARYVAMADQDDCWYPEKLELLLAEIGGAQLVYSDARVIDSDGAVISDTYWSRRRNNHTSLLSLLVANSVTGAASLMRRDLLTFALPFPPPQFAHYHDHWVALCALSLGEIAFLDRPLYDYVQHGDAALGHAAANRMTALSERLRSQRSARERVGMWRMHYFVDASRLTACATVLQMRCGAQMAPAKRRTLERFLATERSLPALASLAARGARELVGRPETLGAEWMLAHAFAWRRLLRATVSERPRGALRLDAIPPPDLAPQPGRHTPHRPEVRAIAEKIAPLELAPSDSAVPRVNILIPTIDLGHLFGGYIAKLNLAQRLAETGLRARIVTTDPVGALPASWRETLQSYSGLSGLLERVELVFGRESHGIETSREDSFIASTWWTAHIAHSAVRSLRADRERFLYLIQEYEPFTFPMGSYAALASASYRLPHCALFSSELLRDYFRCHRIGVYAAGTQVGDARSAAFQNAITEVEAPSATELAGRRTRKLLFYARPEPHATRNMFELGVLALERALAQGAFSDGWELNGIGTVQGARRVSLAGGAWLELLPRSAQASYAQILRRHDVGLALMYTPHPSLVPIEMASAGMLTVTNTFENKTPAALGAISSNLIAAEPTIEDIAAGLGDASARVEDFQARARGSEVRWSRDWSSSFDGRLLRRIGSFLVT